MALAGLKDGVPGVITALFDPLEGIRGFNDAQVIHKGRRRTAQRALDRGFGVGSAWDQSRFIGGSESPRSKNGRILKKLAMTLDTVTNSNP